MEFGGAENWKDFMALVVLRFVVYRKNAVSRVAKSSSCQIRYHCYHFRNDRALMNDSNNEMRQGHNLRWETGFRCTKPLPHRELLILLQTRDIFHLPGPSGQSLQNFEWTIFQSLCRSLSLWSEDLSLPSKWNRKTRFKDEKWLENSFKATGMPVSGRWHRWNP